MQVHYFEKKGPENTEQAVALAVEAARALGIRQIVAASTTGETAEALAKLVDPAEFAVTVVTHAYGQKEANQNPMPEALRQRLTAEGFHVLAAAHALSGTERALSTQFGGIYPVEIIAHTLRMFGQGTKVCVEIAAMAADAGYLTTGEAAVAIGGSARGADTVLVLRPAVSSKILETKIDRIICKPIL